MVCYPSLHRGRHAQARMYPAEVVVHEVNGGRVQVILNLFAEPIGEACEAAHSHPHCEILPLHKASGDVLNFRMSCDYSGVAADALGWAVPHFFLGRAVELY